MIAITPKAAQKIRHLMTKQGRALEEGLRVGVKTGGCSGLSYVMSFDSAPKPLDKVYEGEGGVKVFVDVKSLMHLNGLTLDYTESLMESGFKFLNPNVTKSCSCGESFSTKPKPESGIEQREIPCTPAEGKPS